MSDRKADVRDFKIVCVSDLFWDEHWSSEQQLMSRFAKICRVLYVERSVSLFSFFTGIADASVGRQFRRWANGGLRGLAVEDSLRIVFFAHSYNTDRLSESYVGYQ